MDLQYFVELFCGGLTRGSIYALIALGYTMVYGIIELINFAHGEIYMIGAFTALIVASALGIMGFPAAGIIVIAALAAVIWCAAYGYTIEKIAYRPLRGAPRLSPLISAIGVSSVPLYEARALDLRQVFTYAQLQQQSQGMMQYSLYNGKYMLNPYFPSASNIIIYNKTLMETKGVSMPDAEALLADPDASGWTWDAFKAAAKAVTDEASGIYGFATNSLDPVGMMLQQGGALYNSSVTELKFVGDERFAKGLEFWRSLVTEGCMLNPNSRSNHGTVIVSEFYEQKVGMIYTTSSNIVKFTKEAKDAGFEIGVLPFPKETQFFTNQGGSGIIILDNKPAEEQEAAAEFLRWLNTAGNDAYMCAVSGYMPVVTAAMDEEALKEVYAATPLLKTATELMQFGITSPQGKAKAACDKAINDYCKLIWSELDTSIDRIVKQVTSKAQYEIEANQ